MKGFSNWTKKDFLAFVKGCERYGRKAIHDIAREVEGKSFEEIQIYSKVFWERCSEIAGFLPL